MKQLRIAPLVCMSLFCLAVFMGISFAPVIEAAEEVRPIPVRGVPEVRPSEIRGTVRINGWTGDTSLIKIQAVPMGITSSDEKRTSPDPRATTKTARLVRTADSHLFTFRIMGLHPATLYRLGMEVPPNPISPKIFWRGPMDGLAVSGGSPVVIEGFAARTEIEILDSRGNWVGADDLQFTDPETALRSLRWKSTVRGVVAGELQISTERFPLKGEFGPCDEPERGIVYRKQFSIRDSEWQEIGSLDFRKILTPGRTSPPRDDETPPGTAPTDDIPVDYPADDITLGSSSADGDAVSDNDYQMLLIGAPVYVRVVPITEDGPACNIRKDGVHGWVILAKLPGGFEVPEPSPDPPAVKHILEPQFSVYNEPDWPSGWKYKGILHPTYGELAYKVTKDHKLPPCSAGLICEIYKSEDPIGYALVYTGKYSPGVTLPEGKPFYFTPPCYSCGGGGFSVSGALNSIGGLGTGLVTGAIDLAGEGVTWFSKLAEDIKDAVANVAVNAIAAVGLKGACDDIGSTFGKSCEEMVKTGMEYGLVSMGVPPSLPNWDELKDQGVDYLAQEIASEIEKNTGVVPAELTEAALKKLANEIIDEMDDNQGSANGKGYDWIVPYNGMEPAVWEITIEKNGTDPLPPNLYIRTTDSNGLFMHGKVHVPKVFPSSGIIKIPIVLQPDYKGITPPLCRTGFGPPTCEPSPWLNKPACQTWGWNNAAQKWDWITYDCGSTNHVGIYYRDAWYNNKIKSGSCVSLSGRTYLLGAGLWFEHEDPFLDFGRFMPDWFAYWEGRFYWDPQCN